MKKILVAIAIGLFMWMAAACAADVRNVQDNYKFVYSIVDTAGNPVASETVNLSIQRASDAYYLDFADTTFKASGWSNKTTALTEDSTNGMYTHTFNPPASETTAEEYIFTVDNASATYGDHQSMTVTYQAVNTASVTVTTNSDKTGYTASTVSDKTGYALTQNFPTNFADLAITATTGMVTVGTNTDKAGYTASTVSDKTGYALTQAFPTNFSDLAITSSTGTVTVGTNSDKDGYSLASSQTFSTTGSVGSVTGSVDSVTNPVAATISDKTGFSLSATGVDDIFNEAMSGHTASGSFGEYMQNLTYYTNGAKDGGVYNGIENMIRTDR